MEGVPGQLTQSQRHNLEMTDFSSQEEPEALAAILQLTLLFPKIFTENRNVSVQSSALKAFQAV